MGYLNLRNQILRLLETKLDKSLTYHGLHHTKNVLACVNKAVKRDKYEPSKARLMRIAALAHDMGYIETYKGHEEKGIEILTPLMIEEGYSQKDIDFVSKMILATKLEQAIHTPEEKLIRDADLDYLGRRDFYSVAKTLFDEWVSNGIITDDFDLFERQELNFLLSHKYFTPFSKKHRRPSKLKRIKELQEKHI